MKSFEIISIEDDKKDTENNLYILNTLILQNIYQMNLVNITKNLEKIYSK